MSLKIAFRVDASSRIGTGHFMRCLTLADALKQRGARIRFVSRHLPAHLRSMLSAKGYEFVLLDSAPNDVALDELAHSLWLGVSQAQDATDSIQALSDEIWDWLIVDHYALDSRWEKPLMAHSLRLMAIDDLADRSHLCDLLLDQTFGRDSGDYQPWVTSGCQSLCGSQYALLRPEFASVREYSLLRRRLPQLKRMLVAMGGTDPDNATGRVLEGLKACGTPPPDCQVTIVMGASAPWLDSVMHLAETMPWQSTVLVNAVNMAQLMADCDLAIGAAGATSWERCCLGLPTVMMALADNQKVIASKLQESGAAILVDFLAANFNDQLCDSISTTSAPASMRRMSRKSSDICDGAGVARVLEVMGER